MIRNVNISESSMGDKGFLENTSGLIIWWSLFSMGTCFCTSQISTLLLFLEECSRLPETETEQWLRCLMNTNIALNCTAYCQLSYVYLVHRSFGSWLCPHYHNRVLPSFWQFIPVSCQGNLDSIPSDLILDSWWIKWQWGTVFSVSCFSCFLTFSLVIVIPTLFHTQLPLPPDLCNSLNQVAHYHIHFIHVGASPGTQHLSGHRLRKASY
jgi:hypothetical protein